MGGWLTRLVPSVLIRTKVQAATHLSLGVGFVAAYTPNTSSSVWIQPFNCSSNLFGQLGAWHHLRLPTEDAPIRKVACGRSHVVALTTEGKGIPTSTIALFPGPHSQLSNVARLQHWKAGSVGLGTRLLLKHVQFECI